ncbi:MAG: LamG domain-containing protein [Chthoniobacterales bacterium]|nr:LamG domain-containing protein [Chthoniobacterales bacterium]
MISSAQITLLVLFCSGVVSRAGIAPVCSYRLGDMDSAAPVEGGVATSTLDDHSPSVMVTSGAPTYTADAAPGPLFLSHTALDFTGGQSASINAVTNVTDNFGIELWVKTRSTSGSRCLAYNGDSASNGWGLMQVDGTFQALFGGVSFVGSAPAPPNTWTHLAIVRDSGTTTFYVNGIAAGTSLSAPHAPSGLFALAAAPPALNAEYFDGVLDEVRVFTFAPGGFRLTDLRYAAGTTPGLVFTRTGDDSTLAWQITDADFRPQWSGDLTSGGWSNMDFDDTVQTRYSTSLFEAVDTTTAPARFYHLRRNIEPEGLPVVVAYRRVDNGNLTALFLQEEASSPTLVVYPLSSVAANRRLVFDLSRTINPPTGDTSGLRYEWTIEYEHPDVPQPYVQPGMQGFDAPILRIPAHTLINTNPGEGVVFYCDISTPEGTPLLRCEIRVASVTGSNLPFP